MIAGECIKSWKIKICYVLTWGDEVEVLEGLLPSQLGPSVTHFPDSQLPDLKRSNSELFELEELVVQDEGMGDQ